MQFERLNPLTGDVASRAPALQAADIPAIAAAAAAAQPEWAAIGPNGRRAVLTKAADALLDRKDDFVAAMCAEIGATAGWALFNLTLAAGMVREAAALTTQIAGEVIPSDKPGCLAMALKEPVGVILGIAPWNAPIILGVRAIAVPLACGNGVILKASEQCPRTHALIIEAFAEAGFPEGLVQVVTNAPADAAAVVGALIDAPEVRRINFTGSTGVGRIIAQRAAMHLKPCLLELGGKAPLVICADADLDEAVKAAAFGAFMNQGQICMSTERLIAGGAANGVLMDATVLDAVTPAMRIYGEESFGPVAAIIRVGGVEEAVRVANDSEYGLAAAVFGRDLGRALAVAQRLETGICHVNGPTVQDEAQMPFGGVKASGYGRFGGAAAIHEFTELRWITIGSVPDRYPI